MTHEAVDVFSRNKFVHKPCVEVDTINSETAMYKFYANVMIVPIDYLKFLRINETMQSLKKTGQKSGTLHIYKLKYFGIYSLWNKKSNKDNKYRIWVPRKLRSKLLNWYHEILQHQGARRLEESVKANCTCPNLSQLCKHITSSCEICSKMKLSNVVEDNQLQLKKDKVIQLWELLLVDLCGPWTIKYNFEVPK